MIGIAVALGYLLQQQLIESALQQEATRAADQVQYVIAPNLEWIEMRKHPPIGAEMLRGIKFPEDAIPIVLHHHEHWNGNGYPLGLKAKAIPLPARIFTVVDVYDALTSERPYRRAMSHEQAIAILRAQNGIVFDPKVVTQSIEIVTSSNPPEPLPLSDL